MKILPPPHNKGQETATGSGEIISSTGGLIQSVNILPETGKPTELHKVPGSVVTSSVRILPLSAPATSAADAGNTVALISAEGPPKPLVSSQAATFTTRSAHQRDFIRLAFCERSLIWLGDKFVSRHRGGYYSFSRLLPATQLISVSDQKDFLCLAYSYFASRTSNSQGHCQVYLARGMEVLRHRQILTFGLCVC